jgi:hypothetical protein
MGRLLASATTVCKECTPQGDHYNNQSIGNIDIDIDINETLARSPKPVPVSTQHYYPIR